MLFSDSIINWYKQNKRNLPWRDTSDPYIIWLSEIILQQTRIAQGLPYFIKFIEAYPTVYDLAKAEEQEVLKLWQGLGYYSRARNLYKTAQYIAFELNGIFPKSYKELLRLKGVGNYTAAAIASFCYKEPVPVVDGNVYRVLARFFDVETDISSSIAKKEFTELAAELIDKNKPDLFNQAIMEFGALQCIPHNPDCGICVFNDSCLALKQKKVRMLPVKSKNKPVKKRFFNFLVFVDSNGQTILEKRNEKDIWQNLYQFPLLESESEYEWQDMQKNINNTAYKNYEITSFEEFPDSRIIHKLTHQQLMIRFWKIHTKGELKHAISYDKIKSYPFPIVVFNFIEKNF